MSEILNMQDGDDVPTVPAEEKASTLSLTYCHNSAVSIVMCQAIRRW